MSKVAKNKNYLIGKWKIEAEKNYITEHNLVKK